MYHHVFGVVALVQVGKYWALPHPIGIETVLLAGIMSHILDSLVWPVPASGFLIHCTYWQTVLYSAARSRAPYRLLIPILCHAPALERVFFVLWEPRPKC
jgi:hypothetical protein